MAICNIYRHISTLHTHQAFYLPWPVGVKSSLMHDYWGLLYYPTSAPAATEIVTHTQACVCCPSCCNLHGINRNALLQSFHLFRSAIWSQLKKNILPLIWILNTHGNKIKISTYTSDGKIDCAWKKNNREGSVVRHAVCRSNTHQQMSCLIVMISIADNMRPSLHLSH